MTTNRNFSEAFAFAALALGGSVLLCACSSAQSSVTRFVDDAVQTASGRITEVKDRAQKAVKPVIDTLEETERRIDAVGSGVTKVQQGIDQLKEAMQR